MPREIEKLRKSISTTASKAEKWFLSNSKNKNQENWGMRGGLDDNGSGAVYAFFTIDEKCLYVGQTTQTLKQKANTQTSKHYDASWWQNWHTLRFMNMPNRTDQIVLEMLLILSLGPIHNTKPGSRNICEMFGA